MTYALGPYNWIYDPVVTWSFETTGVSTYGGTSFSNPVTSPAEQSLIEQAFAAWQSVSGVTPVQVADNRGSGQTPDIRIGLGNLLNGSAGSGNEIGVTLAYYYRGTSDFAPGITIQLQDPSITPLHADADGTLIYSGSDTSFEQVALHEIGHALGLEHDSSPTAVMYPVATDQNRTLSASDIAGIQAFYGPNQGQDVSQTTLYLQNASTDYTLAQDGAGALLVHDNVGTEGTTEIATDQVYSFADGTAFSDPNGAAADIARLYHAALGRDPDLGGLASATDGADSGVSLVQIAAGMIASPEYASYGWNQLSDMQFIAHAYETTFGRAVDASGEQTWSTALANGVGRAQMLVGLAQSQEARQLYQSLAGDKSDAEVTRLYETAFDRTPDASGMLFYAKQLDAGTTGLQVAQALVVSQEFAQGYGALDDTDFVRSLYDNALGRAPDPGGLAGYVNQLDRGVGRADIVLGFADSVEHRFDTAAQTHDGYVLLKG